MKIKNIFEEELVGTETVMVSLDSTVLNGIVRTNETASFIISCLKNDITEERIISNVCNRYNVCEDVARQGVSKILVQLRNLDLIEE